MGVNKEVTPSICHVIPAEVEGNCDVIRQALTLLGCLTDMQYKHVSSPYLQSGIGQHMRHILDLYSALMAWPESDFINYDTRRRTHPVETDRSIAQFEWQGIAVWLSGITSEVLSHELTVSGEVSLTRNVVSATTSTLGRELVFTASHAVHHFALIRVALCSEGFDVDETLGVAPATATYNRGE